MRGRKPLPTHIKEARGNPGKRRLNKNEPKPESVVPPCPPFFNAEAKREWERMVYLLLKTRIMTELDVPALMLYCQAYSRWMAAERNVKKHGDVILTPDKKFPVQSPFLAIANKAMEQLLKIMIEFGMTPSSRSRVHIVPHTGPSELDLFVASKDCWGSGDDPYSKSRFFKRRPNPVEVLLERARRSREAKSPFDDTTSQGGDEADGESPDG